MCDELMIVMPLGPQNENTVVLMYFCRDIGLLATAIAARSHHHNKVYQREEE